MSTHTDRRNPVVRIVGTVAFGLVTLGVAAVVWLTTLLSWIQVAGDAFALAAATAVAVVPLVGLASVGLSAEAGPTLSKAAYVAVFAAATVAFVVAAWTIVFVLLFFPLGLESAANAAGGISLLSILAITGLSAAAIAALGRSADWPLVLRMAVAILLLALVTVGFLAIIWTLTFVALALFVGSLAVYVASAVTLVVLWRLGVRELRQVQSIEDRIDATPTTPDDLPGIHATVTKIASQLGVPKPTVAISETYAPEAMVVGFRPDDTHLILSYGTVRALEADQLEAVIAHELAHVANRDSMVMTAVSTPVVLADGLRARVRPAAFRDETDEDETWEPPEEPDADADADEEWGREEIFGPNDEWRVEPPSRTDDDDRDDDGWFVKMTLFVIATVTWVVSRAIVAVLSRAREMTADRTAAEVTGSPAALAGALRTLDARIDETPARDLREAASVSSLSILPLEWVADADDPSLLDRCRARLFRTHPPTEQRLAALAELEREHEHEHEHEHERERERS